MKDELESAMSSSIDAQRPELNRDILPLVFLQLPHFDARTALPLSLVCRLWRLGSPSSSFQTMSSPHSKGSDAFGAAR